MTVASKLITFTLCTLFTFLSAGIAYAHKLDPKWAMQRTEANALGDQAKAGDARAYSTLESRTIMKGSAPFRHNVAWIYQNGHGGSYDSIYSNESANFKTTQSLKIACKLYETAAEEKYPPAMHAYANLCLLPKATHPDDPDDAKMMQQARDLLTDSALLGWPNSAVLLAKLTWHNNPDLSGYEIKRLNDSIKAGFASNPEKSESANLSYFKAMITLNSLDQNSLYYSENYKIADLALRFAIKHDHVYDPDYHTAGEALLSLREKWFTALLISADAWSFRQSLDECASNIQSEKSDKYLAKACRFGYSVNRRIIDDINEGTLYLYEFLSDEEKSKMHKSINKLTEKSANFQAERKTWEDIVVKGHTDRVNAGFWKK